MQQLCVVMDSAAECVCCQSIDVIKATCQEVAAAGLGPMSTCIVQHPYYYLRQWSGGNVIVMSFCHSVNRIIMTNAEMDVNQTWQAWPRVTL